MKKKIIGLIAVILVAIIAVGAVLYSTGKLNLGLGGNGGEVNTLTTSTLEEVKKTAKLSLVEYNGTFIVPAKDEEGNLMYHVKYTADVVAGIDADKIDFRIDEATKKVTIYIPKTKVTKTVVNAESLAFIFEDKKYDNVTTHQNALRLCEEDLKKREDEYTANVLKFAEKNSRQAVEQLFSPWIEQLYANEYTVEYQEVEA